MTDKQLKTPTLVYCFWRFDATKPRHKVWDLVEVIGGDSDGYLLSKPQHFEVHDHRHPWMDWMQGRPDDEEAPEEARVSLMGRAVTVWSVERGVTLLAFNPPAWVDWLARTFYEELKKLPNWYSLLEGGHTLWAGSAREVERSFLCKPKE